MFSQEWRAGVAFFSMEHCFTKKTKKMIMFIDREYKSGKRGLLFTFGKKWGKKGSLTQNHEPELRGFEKKSIWLLIG